MSNLLLSAARQLPSKIKQRIKISPLFVRYEDLTGLQQFEEFQKLFAYCDIAMPDKILKELLTTYSFEAMSGGRQRGEEDRRSHYRKGIANDWQTDFSEKHIAEFQAITGNLVSLCGYSW